MIIIYYLKIKLYAWVGIGKCQPLIKQKSVPTNLNIIYYSADFESTLIGTIVLFVMWIWLPSPSQSPLM